MKAIIDGKKYDTKTAEKIADGRSKCGRSDFGWYEESLYLTKNGNYFLAGRGHAASKYAKSVDGNTRGPGSRIIPQSEEEARAWAEEHLTADEYENLFQAEEA